MYFKTITRAFASVITAAVCLGTGAVSAFAAGDLSFSRDLDAIGINEGVTAADEEEKEFKYKDIPVSSFVFSDFTAQTNSELERVNWSFTQWEDCHYIFLPATADRKKLHIDYVCDEGEVFLDGEKIVSGEDTDILSKKDEFKVTTAKDTDCGILKIMQSDHGSIFMQSEGNIFNDLYNNRWLNLTAHSLMLDAEGNVVYDGGIEKVSAHGNSSWDYSKKKPYNIKLPEKADLFGMGKAKKWVLLSK